MPLMLEEDYQISLPSMHRVRQKFDRSGGENPFGICKRRNFRKNTKRAACGSCRGKPRNQESGFHCT